MAIDTDLEVEYMCVKKYHLNVKVEQEKDVDEEAEVEVALSHVRLLHLKRV